MSLNNNAPQTPLVEAVRRTHHGSPQEVTAKATRLASTPTPSRASRRPSATRTSRRSARRRTIFLLAVLTGLLVGVYVLVGNSGGPTSVAQRARSAAVEIAATNKTAADGLDLLGFGKARSAPAVGPVCDSNRPSYLFGFAALKAQIGNKMGDPLECEHPIYPSGDTQQLTTTGLAYYRRGVNIPSFVSGLDHWALTDKGLQHWIGDVVDPPGTAQSN